MFNKKQWIYLVNCCMVTGDFSIYVFVFLVLPWSSQHSKRRFLRRRIPTRHGSMHPAGCNVPWRQCVICHQWHNQACRHKRLPSYNCHKVGLKVAISSMEGMCTKHILWPMYHEKHMPVVVINLYMPCMDDLERGGQCGEALLLVL